MPGVTLWMVGRRSRKHAFTCVCVCARSLCMRAPPVTGLALFRFYGDQKVAFNILMIALGFTSFILNLRKGLPPSTINEQTPM